MVMDICDININYSEKEFWSQLLRLSWQIYIEKLTFYSILIIAVMISFCLGFDNLEYHTNKCNFFQTN